MKSTAQLEAAAPTTLFMKRPDGLRVRFVRNPAQCPITGCTYYQVREDVSRTKAQYGGPILEPGAEPLDKHQFSRPPTTYLASAAERFATVRGNLGRSAALYVRRWGESPAEAEIKRLRSEGFVELAKLLESRIPAKPDPPADPKALFDLGTVEIAASVAATPTATFKAPGFIERHTHGDHGEIVPHGEVLSEAERWCPQNFGTAVENVAALASGFGLVRSTFKVRDADPPPPKVLDGTWRRPPEEGRPNPMVRLHVLTLIAPGRPSQTLVWCAQ